MQMMEKIENMLGSKPITLDGGVTITRQPTTRQSNRVMIQFSNGRKRVVHYRCNGDMIRFWSVCVASHLARNLNNGWLAEQLLARNRVVDVVGFTLAPKGGIEAEFAQRATTLQRDELLFYLILIAREADRFAEYVTQKDRE
ncbi:MAG: hypothetical protein JNJ94_16320 [Chlorobi bacterium]|nr:hypothetical protein [Chlorobiota bacterium]